MARARNIKPAFFTDGDLCELQPLSRLLFAGLWCLADREGRLKDKPRDIKAQILPFDDVDTNELLDSLSPHFITRYEVDGEKYIQVNNFGEHQNPHKQEASSKIPPPKPVGKKRTKARTKSEVVPKEHGSPPADSLNLIPDSLNTDSGFLIADSLNSDSESMAASGPCAPRHKYGEYGWVRLTADEKAGLIAKYGEDTFAAAVKYIDESAQSTGNKNKWRDWNLVLHKCIRLNWGGVKGPGGQRKKSFTELAAEMAAEMDGKQ